MTTLSTDAALQDAAARLAVLPFESLSGDGDAYFARGFVDDLVVALSRFPNLEVLHPDASLADPASFDPAALGVTLCLRGSVRRAGDVVRVTVQLADARTGRSVWAERFDAPANELLAALDDVVGHVASALAIEIDVARLTQARRQPLASLEVYDCWLRGIDALRAGSLEDDARARVFFERALELDPTCARAHVGLSLSHFNEWSCQIWEKWDEKEHLAHEHAARAVALDDADAQAQIVLARIEVYRREFDAGARRVERAVALNPNDADVLAHAALVSTYLGDPRTGIELARKAIRLHPRRPDWYDACLVAALFSDGRDAEACAAGAPVERAFVDIPAYLAAAAAYAGDATRASRYLDVFLAELRDKITFGRAIEPGEPLRWLEHVNPYRRAEDIERLTRGVVRAGLAPEPDAGARRVPIAGPRFRGAATATGDVRPVFRRDGDVWAIAYDGEVVRLSEVKGFGDLSVLLGRPFQHVHCLELAGRPLDVADADATLDERGRREVRARIRALEDEIEEAERCHDPDRATRAREQLDELVDSLAAVLGLGGRPRQLGSQVERARSTVTWRIRSAIRKIAAAHPAAGRHLENAVRTGTSCVYQPETALDWQL